VCLWCSCKPIVGMLDDGHERYMNLASAGWLFLYTKMHLVIHLLTLVILFHLFGAVRKNYCVISARARMGKKRMSTRHSTWYFHRLVANVLWSGERSGRFVLVIPLVEGEGE